MDSNLILYDIDHFLDKYTRFMTKDIYISNKMYHHFLEQYQYLYQILEKNRFLYSDNVKYQKMINVDKNQDQLVKLHNQKYLQRALKKYQSFFEKLYLDGELDTRRKLIILSEEDKMLVIQDKNVESLLVGKINFLLEKYQYSDEQILVLVKDMEQKIALSEEFQKREIKVSIQMVKDYGVSLLKEEEQVLDDDGKYALFSQYLINQLFCQKSAFQKLYDAFSKYIYLNKDYKDYETFKDYHHYMYKRKLLASGLSLKKFNEQEIKKRRTYLRTIQNEIMKTKEEVDIANFLYLNSIPYHYQYDISVFSVWLDEKKNRIQYLSEKEPLKVKDTWLGETIYLYCSYIEKKSFLEVLAYELIKRRYPLELVADDSLYNQLKNTTIENYFSEFIRNYLIPIVDYYEEYGTLEKTRLNLEQQEVIMDLYLVYKKEVEKYHYVRKQELLSRVEEDILKKNYRYLFLVGDISLRVKIPTFTIVSHYQEVQLLRENIKLLYDYKKYLYQNQRLPIAHVYLDYQELNYLTASFLKENLVVINKAFEENKKEIEIQYYEDGNRLHVYQNISVCCDKLLENATKNTMLAFIDLKDMKLLISSRLFSKCDKNTLFTQNREKILCEEVLKISKLYDTIILPYLITDYYHEDFLKTDYDYYIKVMLYVALSKCRQKVVLLCPRSRKQELKKILKNLKKQVITE